MSLLSRVRRTILEHELARGDTRVLVAVSGGSDSVALAHVVAALERSRALVVAGLAHFNHQLRPTAARDEAFCRDLAASLGQPIEVGRGDVEACARDERRSIEDAAHQLRYGFLEAARLRLGADVIALGHTRDDQAETFLLRLLRGAGARGLAGMHPRSGTFVRPLLDCRRAELVEWLRDRAIPYVTDETNDDLSIPRNRVRARLLPLIAEEFNPAIVDVLADAAELARSEWLWLEAAADAALADAAVVGDGFLDFDVARLRALPVALQRAVLWRALSRLSSRPVGFGHVRDAVRLIAAPGAAEVDAPGVTLKRLGGRLVLRSGARQASGAASEAGTNLFAYSLSIPGEVSIPEAGGLFVAEEPAPAPRRAAAAGGGDLIRAGSGVPAGHEAVVRRDLCGAQLCIRNRRPGDRYRPVGLGGSRKLQDVFVDRKIERAARDRIPVVVAENGRILWVAGVGIAEEFRVTDPAQPMLILRFKVWGGSA